MPSSLLEGARDAVESLRGSSPARSISVPHVHLDKPATSSDATSATDSVASPRKDGVRPLDLMVSLKRTEPSIVKTRTGSVLSRGFILKTDYYPSGQWPPTGIPGLVLTRGAGQVVPWIWI